MTGYANWDAEDRFWKAGMMGNGIQEMEEGVQHIVKENNIKKFWRWISLQYERGNAQEHKNR